MGFLSKIWHKYLGGQSTAWADLRLNHTTNEVVVVDWNDAFAATVRDQLGHEVTHDKTNSQVIAMYNDRSVIEHEEPKLDVKHLGITNDGLIKTELDWNQAFIRHLRDNGITGETDEQAIQLYLSLLTKNVVDEDEDEPNQLLSREQVDMAFDEIDHETARELEEAAQQIDAFERKRARQNKSRRSTRKKL